MGKKMTHKEFTKRLEEENPYFQTIEILSIYTNSHAKMKFYCKKHNVCFEKAPTEMLSKKTGCPRCGYERTGNKLSLSYEAVEKMFLDCGYILLSKEYKNLHEKLSYICRKHPDNIFEIAPNDLKHGVRCPLCKKENFIPHNKLDYNFVKSKFLDNGYILLDTEYSNNQIPMRYICKEHPDKISKMSYGKLTMGQKCPFCRQSQLERKVCLYLDARKINYIPQYRFDDCRNKLPLPFDFAIFDNKENLMFLCETDGRQHFELVEIYGEEEFELTQKRDRIKNEYCKNNNIKLIRIPYWEIDNIEEILKKELNF